MFWKLNPEKLKPAEFKIRQRHNGEDEEHAARSICPEPERPVGQPRIRRDSARQKFPRNFTPAIPGILIFGSNSKFSPGFCEPRSFLMSLYVFCFPTEDGCRYGQKVLFRQQSGKGEGINGYEFQP